MSGTSRTMETMTFPVPAQEAYRVTAPYEQSYGHRAEHNVSVNHGPLVGRYPISTLSNAAILNAEQHNDARISKRSSVGANAAAPVPGPPQSFYSAITGFGYEGEAIAPLADLEEEMKPRKRRRLAAHTDSMTAAGDEEEASKKARGRPRVATEDETAADVSTSTTTTRTTSSEAMSFHLSEAEKFQSSACHSNSHC